MIYKPSELQHTTKTILNNDEFIIQRGDITYIATGELLKEKISNYYSSPVTYLLEDNEFCKTRGEVFSLGALLLSSVGYTIDAIYQGLAVRILYNDTTFSNSGWMYLEGSTLKVLTEEGILFFDQGDTTLLAKDIAIQSLSGFFKNTLNLNHEVFLQE